VGPMSKSKVCATCTLTDRPSLHMDRPHAGAEGKAQAELIVCALAGYAGAAPRSCMTLLGHGVLNVCAQCRKYDRTSSRVTADLHQFLAARRCSRLQHRGGLQG